MSIHYILTYILLHTIKISYCKIIINNDKEKKINFNSKLKIYIQILVSKNFWAII